MLPVNSSDPLIPVRALNQINFCERLFYLQYVEGLMQVNAYVEDGSVKHRRMAQISSPCQPRIEDGVTHTRNVSLSSERLGITAKLDLVEETASKIFPVEYKRSSAPAGGKPWWENDAIQLCAQVFLLEEHLGKAINEGVLYYMGSKSRSIVPMDASLREKTLHAIRRARELFASEKTPPPLPVEKAHRCEGCSLVAICQPEETRMLTGMTPLRKNTVSGVNRVMPTRNDGAVLYLQEQGSRVSKQSEHLIVRCEGKEMQKVPMAAVRQVVLFGNVQISTQTLGLLLQQEVDVTILSARGRFIGAVVPAPTKNITLRAEQYRLFSNPAATLRLSQACIRAKISNQRTLLMRSLRSKAGDGSRGGDSPAAAERLTSLSRSALGHPWPVQELARLVNAVERVEDVETLLGVEGQAAHVYFSNFQQMIKPISGGFDFEFRNRRPPRDPVNALLSLAYSLLAKDAFAAALTVGFDPYLGFYHGSKFGRPSLALDMMEEFRAVIADSVVLTVINTGVVQEGDFLRWGNACQLTDPARKRFFEAYEQRKAVEITHPVFGYKMTCGRMLEVQARLLAAHVRGDISEYKGFTVR